MFVEVWQFLDLIVNHRIHGLILFFIIFVVASSLLKRIGSSGYKPIKSKGNYHPTVSIAVPTYNQDAETFRKCLESINRQTYPHIVDKIVILDKGSRYDKELESIAKQMGFKLITNGKRLGKRKAVAKAVRMARGEVITLIDSDTILAPDCIENVVKAFEDPNVAGVHVKINPIKHPNGSQIPYVISHVIELSRDVTNRLLSKAGVLVVVDGRCMSWRRKFILPYIDALENEKFLGQPCIIGDDRFLTRCVLKAGYKVVYQPSAQVETLSPPTFKELLKQQLRWSRSGYKFFLEDIYEGLIFKLPPIYFLHCFLFYAAPILFSVVVLLDLFILPHPASPLIYMPTAIAIWLALPMSVLGSATVSLIRQMLLFGKVVARKYIIHSGIFGLCMIGIMYYALLTIHKQGAWLTR